MNDLSTESAKRPLITLFMVTYNHEPFIRQALEGAAAQTYSPLEIIVSDDASTDKTAALIRAFVAHYQGPHTWRVNVNERNLGVLSNCMRVAEMARGEWFVAADGDDVSLPERVEACYRHQLAHPGEDYFICKAEWMDARGAPIPADFGHPKVQRGVIWNIRHHVPGAWGTCSCHHRRLYDSFGVLCTPGLRMIDMALAFRAVLLGGRVNFMDESLVRYRQHAGGVVSANSAASGISLCEKYQSSSDDLSRLFQQMALDVVIAHKKGFIDAGLCRDALRVIREETYSVQTVAEALAAPLPLRALKFVGFLARGFGASLRNACAIKSGFVYRR